MSLAALGGLKLHVIGHDSSELHRLERRNGIRNK